MPSPANPDLLLEVQRQYRLEWLGLHGAAHWARVLENGLRLRDVTPGLRRDGCLLGGRRLRRQAGASHETRSA
jgi:hypothetical protein